MSNLRALAAMIAAATLSACASMTSGTTQSIALQTTPSTGAECQIVNEKGTWLIPATPGSTTINRAYGDLVVTCAHKNGMKGSASVQSTTVGAAFGNILAGGLIGAAVDMSSGAAYQYPATINVALVSGSPGDSAPRTGGSILSNSARPSTEEVSARLKQLLELREKGLIPEDQYRARVKAIVDEL